MKRAKGVKKAVCVLLSVLVCAGVLPIAANTVDVAEYRITNPYSDVDWSTVRAYKTALHTHTNASDGRLTLRESLERHVETGFEIVATTDHGTVNYSWSNPNPNKLVYNTLSLVGKSNGELDYLSDSGSFANGTTYRIETADNGDDYLIPSEGNSILRIPYGIENNAVSINAHVNSWFADYCDNSIETHNDSIRGVEQAGGLSVINHPGVYTKARFELHGEDAYNLNTFSYSYYVNKFARLLDRYDSCIGIDINSDGDGLTRYDRVLWDILLTRFSAKGENVFGIATSDAHSQYIVDSAYTYLLLQDKTSAEARKSLESGEFFAGSHFIGNYDELVIIAEGVKKYYGENEVYNNLMTAVSAIDSRIEEIESGRAEADSKVDIKYTLLDSEGYCTAATQPMITDITVDDDNDQISIDTENALIVRWISQGKQIAVTKADDSTLDLNDYGDTLGDYVRAEVFGEGGVLYTQAFLLNADEKDSSAGVTVGFFADIGVLDCLFAVVNDTLRKIKISVGSIFNTGV